METTLTAVRTMIGGATPIAAPIVPALCLLWSRAEPGRIGEVALLGAPVGGGPIVVGRAGGRRDLPRAEWVQQRPGRNFTTGPLAAPRISRDQLLVDRCADDRLAITNIGKLPLLVRGRPASGREELAVGDLVELGGEALLLVIQRPIVLPPAEQGEGDGLLHPFGEADGDGIVGESPAAYELRDRVAFVAARTAHVLIRGASGTGKELVAQAIHRRSERRSRAIVARNAATIPETLVDAELFGHARNFPNPGMPERAGLVGEADRSTLFLDEFAELPPALQAHLLRVMDHGEYQRLGESKSRRSDFRLIAATNRPESALKHDVLARLQIRIEIPGLDARREDVPLIARQVLRGIATGDPDLARRFFVGGDPRGVPSMTPALVAALVTHPYSTHVRELEALLWLAMSRARASILDVCDGLQAAWTIAAPTGEAPATSDEAPEDEEDEAVGDVGAGAGAVDPMSIPVEVLQACLDRHEGRQEPVWRELGLSSRHVLTRLVRRHGLTVRGRSGSSS